LETPVLIFIAALGFFAGSVANALASAMASHRLPVEPDQCISCARWPGSRPRVSILASLRRTCSACGARHPHWPVLTEIAMAALFVALYGRFGLSPATAIFAIYSIILAVALVTDLRHRLIFNALTYPGIALAGLVAVVTPGSDLLASLAGGLGFGGLLLAMSVLGAILYGRGLVIGMGDVKLAIFIGLITGVPRVLTALSVTVVLGGVFALAILLLRRSNNATMPYAPPLVLGAIFTILTSNQ
jgi:leader peptidase (prepilin peptidase) / N-methyltransferase